MILLFCIILLPQVPGCIFSGHTYLQTCLLSHVIPVFLLCLTLDWLSDAVLLWYENEHSMQDIGKAHRQRRERMILMMQKTAVLFTVLKISADLC